MYLCANVKLESGFLLQSHPKLHAKSHVYSYQVQQLKRYLPAAPVGSGSWCKMLCCSTKYQAYTHLTTPMYMVNAAYRNSGVTVYIHCITDPE